MSDVLCSAPGCLRLLHCRGMCALHYRRTSRGVPIDKPLPVRFVSRVCSVEGCSNKKHSLGMCSTHHTRFKRWGDPHRSTRHFWKATEHKGLWHGAKARAKRDNLPFDITPESIVVPERCPVLGIPLIRGVNIFTDNSPTVDKIYPAKGYVMGNIHVISYLANRIKTNATPEQIIAVGRYFKGLNERVE